MTSSLPPPPPPGTQPIRIVSGTDVRIVNIPPPPLLKPPPPPRSKLRRKKRKRRKEGVIEICYFLNYLFIFNRWTQYQK